MEPVVAAGGGARVEEQKPCAAAVSGGGGGGGEEAGAQPRGVKRGIAAAEAVEPLRVSKRTRRDRPSTAKDRISKIPPSAVGKRSSIYRGVTRHRWTGRYEAHLWDKSTWNQTQNKKGKQVYLGAYDEEEAAARAYDLAALKYWGPGTIINFPVTDYARDIEEMQNVSREEYLASLRRKSSGFSRGVSKYRGVARHHHNGRWEARIGRVFGNKYLYLGTYSTQEEAAAAYDMAAIEYRGLNAVTNFDLSRYIKWLRPGQGNNEEVEDLKPGDHQHLLQHQQQQQQQAQAQEQQSQAEPEESPVQMWPGQASEPYQFPSLGLTNGPQAQRSVPTAPTALGLLWQSNMFKQMLEKASAHSTPDSQHEGDVLGMPMFPGLEEDPTLPYDEGQSDGVYQDMPFPSCFGADGQELDSGAPFWNSLGASVLPLRSPITV